MTVEQRSTLLHYYKFLSSEHIDSFMKGELRFGNLNYFRMLEAITGDYWIGDMHDGRRDIVVDHISVAADDPTRDGREELNRLGILSASDGPINLQIKNFRIIKTIEGFVFCFSFGEIGELCRTMCRSDDSHSYDSCVRLASLEQLQEYLRKHATHGGIPLADEFEIKFGHVRYESQETNFDSTGMAASADPFVKLLRYRDQREARLVLIPKDWSKYRKTDFLTLRVNHPDVYLVEEFRRLDVGKRSEPSTDGRDCSELILVLLDFVQAMEVFPVDLRNARRDDLIKSLAVRTNTLKEVYVAHCKTVLEAYWRMRNHYGLFSPRLEDEFLYGPNYSNVAQRVLAYLNQVIEAGYGSELASSYTINDRNWRAVLPCEVVFRGKPVVTPKNIPL